MKRSLFSARLLALALAVSLLVSCGPKLSDNSGSGSASGSASGSQSEPGTVIPSKEERIRKMAQDRVRGRVEEAAAIVTATPAQGGEHEGHPLQGAGAQPLQGAQRLPEEGL